MYEETHVWMRCTVNFRGHLVPVIEWRQHVGVGEEFMEGHEITTVAENIIIPNSTIISELTVVFMSNTSQLFCSFKIYFRSVNDSELANATNAPDYSYIWKIPIVEMSSSNLQNGKYLGSHLSINDLSRHSSFLHAAYNARWYLKIVRIDLHSNRVILELKSQLLIISQIF